MRTIENRIDHFFEQTEYSVHALTEGSDLHLDVILRVITPLHQLAQQFEALNVWLLEQIDQLTDEEISKEMLPRMKQLNKSCATLIGSIRTSFLYRDVRQALKKYTRQYEHFREIWHDLRTIRVNRCNQLEILMAKIEKSKNIGKFSNQHL